MREQKCPLCGEAALFEVRAAGRDFFRCGNCDLTFVAPEQHLSAEEEVARYRLHNNTIENAGYVRMFTRKFPVIRQCCPGMRTVLDYGCGPGPVLVELLNREGYEAAGYDPYFAPDADLNRRYDGVISTETFEHFACPARELSRIRSLLRDRGYLMVMTRQRTPDIDFPKWWYIRDPTHIAFYSPAAFTWIAKAFKMKILHQNCRDFVIMQAV